MLKKRIQYFNAWRTTSHWPHRINVNPDGTLFRSQSWVDPKEIMIVLRRQGPSCLNDPVIQSLVGF
jgi:hypothetical protein